MCARCAWRQTRRAAALLAVLGLTGGAAFFYCLPKPPKPTLMHYVREVAGPAPVLTQGEGGWQYFDSQDRLVGDTTRHARLAGTWSEQSPSAHLAAPALELLASAHYGNRVQLTLAGFTARCGREPCVARLAFDQSAPETYGFRDLSAPAQTVLVFDAFDKIYENLNTARMLTLTLSQGDGHDLVIRFALDGFAAEKLE
jgi:hypothetical protein